MGCLPESADVVPLHRHDPDFSLMPELFPGALRSHIRAFGRYIRLVDGIAGSRMIGRGDKIARLAAIEQGLHGAAEDVRPAAAQAIVVELTRTLQATGISPEHATRLIEASRRDITMQPCPTWDDLMAHCRSSAAPIGRFLLDLLHEDIELCGAASDSLCAALRILRQLRDCEDPTVQFSRLYIPAVFLDDALISPQHLRVPFAKGQTRAVLDRVLDGVHGLCVQATPLPGLLGDRALAIQTSIVLCRARKLTRRLRHHDPLRHRISLSPLQRLYCRWSGRLYGLLRT